MWGCLLKNEFIIQTSEVEGRLNINEDNEDVVNYKNEKFNNYLKNNFLKLKKEERNVLLFGNESISFDGLCYYLQEGRRTTRERVEGQAK